MITFADGLKASWDCSQLPLQAFLQHQQACWGQDTFNRFEVLRHGQTIIPYWDFDRLLDQAPSSQQLKDDLDLCISSLTKAFEPDPGFDAAKDLVHGYRHGWVPQKGKHKVSYRFWCPRYNILLEDMKKLNLEFGLHPLFDSSVYSAKQKLGIPGACKSPQDPRVLELEDRALAGRALAQNVPKDSQNLKFPEEVPTTNHHTPSKHQPPPEWEDVAPTLEVAGFTNPVYVGCRATSLTFTCDCLGALCPCGCGCTHDSQNW